MAAKGKTIIATIHQPSSQVKMPYTVTHHLIPYQILLLFIYYYTPYFINFFLGICPVR